MSETRWTVGPWRVESTMRGWDIETEDDLIAMVPCAAGNDLAFSANAHLIAAAPDLAEALEATGRLLTALDTNPRVDVQHADLWTEVFHARAKALAALAKAKGE